MFFTSWPNNGAWYEKSVCKVGLKCLTDTQEQVWFSICCDSLLWFEGDPARFLNRFVTVDESQVHPLTQRQHLIVKYWKHSDSPRHGLPGSRHSFGVSCFGCHCQCNFMMDFFGKGHRVTGQYYATLLWQLWDSIIAKCHGKLTSGVVFNGDNPPPPPATLLQTRISAIAMTTIHWLGKHPPCSSDLAPSDFHLFPDLKKHFAGAHFTTEDALIYAMRDT